MRVPEELIVEGARSWRRVQQFKEWFVDDMEQLQCDNHQRFLEALMGYERQCFLNADPYERTEARTDQANGFYQRRLTTRLGVLELTVPRTRSGLFQTRVLRRYQRREAAVDEALRQVFLLGVSTRQAGPALATLVDDAVSATTVSEVSKVLDEAVGQWHRRTLSDTYRYLLLDGVSVRIRLVGKVQRRMALCAYGIQADGRRELIDFLLVKAESEDTWRRLLEELWRRGLHGKQLKLITTDGHAGLTAAVNLVWPRAPRQRCWVHKLRNLENKLKASQQACLKKPSSVPSAAEARGGDAVSRVESALATLGPQGGHVRGARLGGTLGLLRLPGRALEDGA